VVPSPRQTFVILRVLCGSLLFLAFVPSQQALPQSESALRVQWEPKQLVNGSAALFRVTAPAALKELEATWFDRKLTFRFSSACACWYGIGGVDLNAKPGKYPLLLRGKAENGEALAFSYDVTVAEKRYPRTAVTGIPQKYVQPPPEVAARIAEESAFKKQVFARFEPESLWTGQFAPPVASVVTAIFGSARVVNGTQKAVHQGLDFRAAVGTAVHASNRGTVVLARNLYYEGNCVMIDHGDGLLTFYMHLSEIKVKEGDSVENGQLLGLSGNTGRVNGPHLHFAARWQDMYLDPETLLALHPPTP
jgi:murein DD-endopeptidase MepM/ murein hydrolase activator NlpD